MSTRRFPLALLLALLAGPTSVLALACSSSGVTVAVDAQVDDTAAVDVATDVADSSTPDAPADVAPDTAPDTTPPDTTPVDVAPDTTADTTPVDAGPADTAGTFACGTERCGSTFQVCQLDAAPGTGRHCVAIPSACFAFPACPCVVTKLCGGALKGTCTDAAGAITFQCTP